MSGSMLGRVGSALARPSSGMSWGQLAAAVVFIIVVIAGWRQVTQMIAGEL